jgi:hypothetical protein
MESRPSVLRLFHHTPRLAPDVLLLSLVATLVQARVPIRRDIYALGRTDCVIYLKPSCRQKTKQSMSFALRPLVL